VSSIFGASSACRRRRRPPRVLAVLGTCAGRSVFVFEHLRGSTPGSTRAKRRRTPMDRRAGSRRGSRAMVVTGPWYRASRATSRCSCPSRVLARRSLLAGRDGEGSVRRRRRPRLARRTVNLRAGRGALCRHADAGHARVTRPRWSPWHRRKKFCGTDFLAPRPRSAEGGLRLRRARTEAPSTTRSTDPSCHGRPRQGPRLLGPQRELAGEPLPRATGIGERATSPRGAVAREVVAEEAGSLRVQARLPLVAGRGQFPALPD